MAQKILAIKLCLLIALKGYCFQSVVIVQLHNHEQQFGSLRHRGRDNFSFVPRRLLCQGASPSELPDVCFFRTCNYYVINVLPVMLLCSHLSNKVRKHTLLCGPCEDANQSAHRRIL